MYAQRIVRPLTGLGQNALHRTLSRNAAIVPLLMRRNTTTTSFSADHEKILKSQRAVRPLSPWWVYQPQLTWLMSLGHRATGAGLATVLYGGSLTYITSQMFGLTWDTDSIVAAVSTLPIAAKVAGKFTLGYTFSYHVLNGIRHLVWDSGRSLTIKGVYTGGWTVLGLATLSSVYLSYI